MSYILDALKKAAEQRDRHTPVLKRLLGPAPTPRSVWTRSPGRLLAALLLNAGLLIVLLATWLRPVPIAAPPEAVGVPGVATSPSQQSSALEPPGTMPRTPERRAAPRTAPGPPPPKPAKAVAATPPPPAAAPAAPQQPAPVTRGAAAVPPPATPAQPPTSPSLAGLRLEALIYSDVPEKRMIFVNGRKYVEGDTIEGRLRVEEIQEDGVALSEDGRRMTLRVAR